MTALSQQTIYRTDQIGSLLRPPALLAARDAHTAKKIDPAALRAAEDAAILDALAMQRDAGMAIFTDGEMRRDAWQTIFSQAVEGFVDDYPQRPVTRPDGSTATIQMHDKAVQQKLVQRRRLAEVDAAFLRTHAPGPFKITMPSPSAVARFGYRAGITEAAYRSREALHADATAIVRGEVEALAGDGAAYVQLDEGFNSYVNPDWRCELERAGRSPMETLAADIAADNTCYDAVEGRMTRAMHLCRGSRVTWAHGPGTYDWLAERLFDQLHVDRFLLEYDSDVVGGFEPLRFVPKGKVVVLGLVSSKEAALESQDDLLRRIEDASRSCPIEQLALSTQCGFQGAATRDGAHMTVDEEQRKLELIAATARKVWG
jgi:5-methyltetrahydropteroyltriglutamate--homocysteine methyltransferase